MILAWAVSTLALALAVGIALAVFAAVEIRPRLSRGDPDSEVPRNFR